MSDIVKLNIKSKGIKAVFGDTAGAKDKFQELPAVLEREKQEHAHKLELEQEYQKGYSDGQNQTRKELEVKHSEELLQQSKDFYNIISNFEEKFKVFEENFNLLVIKTSEKLASKILKNEIKLEETVKKTLNENLSRIIGANEIIIKLNPKDKELLQNNSTDFVGITGVEKVRFEASENIQIGGCLIESEIGNIDARVESQMKELVNALQNSLKSVKSE